MSSSSPTTRSRTSLFLSFRESRTRSTRFSRSRNRPRYDDFDAPDDEHQGLINDQPHVALDVHELPPAWVDLSDQVEDLLEDAQSKKLRARDRELTEIAKSIATLAELFKDLSALVIDQGTLLDSVEYNIEQTAVQLEGAVDELKVATKYQKNTGRRKCIFLLLLIIFGLIIVLIFKPKRHRSPPTPSPSPVVSLPPQASLERAWRLEKAMTSIPEGAQKRVQQFTLLDNDSASSLFYRPSNALSNNRDDDDSRPNPFTDPSTPPTGHFDKTSVTPATPSTRSFHLPTTTFSIIIPAWTTLA
ncbi:hypothetical protein D9611_003955 [Ephemerocybe angulata]|uniref:t-SNARE coiled-coil homology domain-containing protein n=1 Tax=Ephemerocybe angulata TaxID=980116 RepID=A0A8H5B603_9AGAR|nr:hypothetical protein D9611_003955 [Tulosesus angulatus]